MADWPHAPVHRFLEAGSYIITGSTYQKEHHFRTHERLDYLCHELLTNCHEAEFNLQAWAIFSNHYHLVGFTEKPELLKPMLAQLHRETARRINEEDDAFGRQVWFQFWDTQLTTTRAYYARLRYVNENPIRHGLVEKAADYPFCSAGWFERKAAPAYQKIVSSFKIDKVVVHDDFVPVFEWQHSLENQ